MWFVIKYELLLKRDRVNEMGNKYEKDHATQDNLQGEQVAISLMIPEKEQKCKKALSSHTEEKSAFARCRTDVLKTL
jgi:hypothetical protein